MGGLYKGRAPKIGQNPEFAAETRLNSRPSRDFGRRYPSRRLKRPISGVSTRCVVDIPLPEPLVAEYGGQNPSGLG